MAKLLKTTFKLDLYLTILSVILGAFIGYLTTEISNIKSDKRDAEKSAMLLYYDLKMASDTIHSLNKDSSSPSEIIYTNARIANYTNNYGELLINLRSELDNHDIQNILGFYKNIEVIEKIQVNLDNYMFEEEKKELLTNEYENYKSFINQMETICNNKYPNNCIDITIEKLKKIADIEH